jgi:hypothetical protein
MSAEESKLPGRRFFEDVSTQINPESCLANGHETLEEKVFGLALAIATEPSKLGQLRQHLTHLQRQSSIPEDFSTWAIAQIDNTLTSMALESAHDAEIILQILSFKGGTLDSLLHDVEDLYRQEKICQRVYARAKLLLWGNEPLQQ